MIEILNLISKIVMLSLNNFVLHFESSCNYFAPIHEDLIYELAKRGWKLIKKIGKGSTNTAFLAENNGRKGVVLIPVSQEYPEEHIEEIIKLQSEGKLTSLVQVYDYFFTNTVVDKKELKMKIEEGIVEYPDYVFFDDESGYNILITELFYTLENSEWCKHDIIKSIEECLTILTNDGWCQTDLHLGNFGISADGKRVKVMDVEGIINEPCEFSHFINKLYHTST